jgi:hypothetical protein
MLIERTIAHQSATVGEGSQSAALEFGCGRCYITGMTAGWEWMRRIIGPVLG